MSLKQQLGDLTEELHKLGKHLHTGDALLVYADVYLRLHELRKTLEKGKDYEHNGISKRQH